jgi:hypothetical protein
MNFTIANMLGAIDKKFEQQYNYLITLLSKAFADLQSLITFCIDALKLIPYYGGTAVNYNDINTGINPRNVGVGRPTLATWVGNIQQFQFAVNDFADMNPLEFLHGWKEGTAIEVHCHWCTGGTNATTVKGVKWEVELSYADMENSTFITPIVGSAETSIAIDESDRSAKYTSIVTFTPTGYKIGTQMGFRLKRIASVTNPAPVANPFVMSIGIHYIMDTLGSRTISSK